MKYYFDEEASVSTRRRVHARPECIVAARLMGVDFKDMSEGDTARWMDVLPRRCIGCDDLIEKDVRNALDRR